MDITPPATVKMGPPTHSSPEMDHSGGLTNGTYADQVHAQGGPVGGLSAAAAASSQQPKVVQTAFIHKLYTYVCGILEVTYLLTFGSVCWKTPVYKS